MIKIEELQGKPNLQEVFAHRQIGSITQQVDPVDVGSTLEFVIDFFKTNPDQQALPIERNGVLIGILDRNMAEKMNESAWTRFWQKDLDAYVENQLFSLRADDYIEKNTARVLQLSSEKGARFFAVFYRKSFFGIVSLKDMLARVTDIRARDMAKAHLVQQHLLEPDERKDDRYSLFTWNRMANEVGGDFFKDFRTEDGDRHIIGCFDVSGKNVSAALSTMAVGSFFTALRYFDLGDKFGEETTVLIDSYIQNLTPSDMFITAAICYVDFKEGTVLVQNCGHTPIYFFIPGEGNKVSGKVMNPNLPPLGMGILGAEKQTSFKIPITKGLRIAIYTDGLTDMLTPDGDRYDDERTRELLASTYGRPEAETHENYTKAIDDWIQDAMLPDDITIMDLRFN
jgi:sigma-B regulation protein RsbU (phosphoserine phosphatase)